MSSVMTSKKPFFVRNLASGVYFSCCPMTPNIEKIAPPEADYASLITMVRPGFVRPAIPLSDGLIRHFLSFLRWQNAFVNKKT